MEKQSDKIKDMYISKVLYVLLISGREQVYRVYLSDYLQDPRITKGAQQPKHQ